MDERKKRRWQNLLYKKCPNCDSRMEDNKLYMVCPNNNEDDPSKSCFFIKKEKAIEYLLDRNHPANMCLTIKDRENLQAMIIGLKD